MIAIHQVWCSSETDQLFWRINWKVQIRLWLQPRWSTILKPLASNKGSVAINVIVSHSLKNLAKCILFKSQQSIIFFFFIKLTRAPSLDAGCNRNWSSNFSNSSNVAFKKNNAFHNTHSKKKMKAKYKWYSRMSILIWTRGSWSWVLCRQYSV